MQPQEKQENVFKKFNKYFYEHPSKHAAKLVKIYIESERNHYDSCYNDISPPPDDLECGNLGARIGNFWRQELDRKGPLKASLLLVLFKTMIWDFLQTLVWAFIVRLMFVLLVVESLRRVLTSIDELKSAIDYEAEQVEGYISTHATNLSSTNGTQSSLSIPDSIGVEILSLGGVSAGESVEEVYRKLTLWLILLLIGISGFFIFYSDLKIQLIRCGLKCRVAMTQLIQMKSLRLHLLTSIEHSSSKALSLISNEVVFIEQANRYLIYLIIGPISLVFATTWLAFAQVNWEPVLLTIPVLAGFVAIQIYLPKLYKKISRRRKEQTNRRINVMNTFLNSVKVVKMYSWEEKFQEKVQELRRLELQQVKCLDRFLVFDLVVMAVSSKVLSAIVFIACIYLYGQLNSHILFTTTTAYNFWRLDGIYFLPKSIKCLSDIKTACKNIRQYLLLDEKKDDRVWVKVKGESRKVHLNSKGVCVSLASNKKHTISSSPSLGYKSKLQCSTVPKLGASGLFKSGNAEVFSPSTPEVNIIDQLDFDLESGDLLFVVGTVGCGKSTLLLTLLGETLITKGQLLTSKGARFAYASQEPCLFSDSFKNNILNGRPLDIERYRKVVHACSLARDIDLLSDGNETLVGPKGMSLSGGQKARLNLARAIYSEADIYLLDDPLSAVDPKVAKNILTKCIKEFLEDKIVILATHQLQFINESKKVIILKRNAKPIFGLTSEILPQKECQCLLEQFRNHSETSNDEHLEQQQQQQLAAAAVAASAEEEAALANLSATDDDNNLSNNNGIITSNPIINSSSQPLAVIENKKTIVVGATGDSARRQAGSEAGKQLGLVGNASVYLYALKIGYGRVGLIFFIVFTILTAIITAASDYYFRIWSDKIFELQLNREQDDDSGDKMMSEQERYSYLIKYWLVFAIITFLYGIITFLFNRQLTRGLRKASEKLHTSMVGSLFKAKVGFYDFCQIGELTSRYAGDFAIVDHVLPINALIVSSVAVGVVSTTIPTAIINPIQVIPCALLLLICLPIAANKYKKQKVLMQLSNSLRSPLYTNLSSTIDELNTIRSEQDHLNNAQLRFNQSQNKLTSISLLAGIYELHISTIIKMIAMSMIGLMFYIMFGIYWRDLDIATAGTFILLAQNVAGLAPALLEYGSLLESAMISITNIRKYTELEPEVDSKTLSSSKRKELACADQDDTLAHLRVSDLSRGKNNKNNTKLQHVRRIEWQVGQVSFRQVSLRYFEDERPAIDRLTFTIEGGERVGVVGRTGAGKSSIVSLLYRLYPFEGTISIDGVDTKTLSLTELRSSLGVIPQDPVLFCDSLRKNLDPFEAYTDIELWRALEIVNLRDYAFQTLSSGLDHMISEGGRNFSVGQRQLVCLARAVLRLPKVLLIDEATANVDADTDAFIQGIIRSQFTKSTIITIAHRLNTVLDYDRVMVLDAGKIVEFDTVQSLLQIEGGLFNSMLSRGRGE